MYDVIIAGAGPVGSRVAFRLAGAGRKVLVLERKDQIEGKRSCTGIVSRECVEAFSACREAVLRPATSATIFTPAGMALRVEKESAPAYVLNRANLDAVMVRMAQESGAEFIHGARVQDVNVSSASAVFRAHFNGREMEFHAKTVVIASGFGSKLLEKLGFQRCSEFAMGAQAEVESRGVGEVEVYLGSGVAPGFFAWVVPTSDGKALVGLLSRRGTGRYLRSFLSRLAEQGKITGSPLRMYFGGVPLKPLKRTYGERVLIVGDAAGQVKPTTGGGIYYGLLCADLAAETIDEAIRRDSFSAGTLSRYDREWRKLLGRELRIGNLARHLYERWSDRRIEELMGTVYARRIHETLLSSPDFSFDWHGRLILRGLRRFGPWAALTLLRGR